MKYEAGGTERVGDRECVRDKRHSCDRIPANSTPPPTHTPRPGSRVLAPSPNQSFI